MARSKNKNIPLKRSSISGLAILAFILMLAMFVRVIPEKYIPAEAKPVADWINLITTFLVGSVLLVAGVMFLPAPIIGWPLIISGGIFLGIGIMDLIKKNKTMTGG